MATTDFIPVDDIPLGFKEDFDLFFFGKTLKVDELNKLYVYPHDIKSWIRYLFEKYEE
ncbi:hypothetical protein GCM10028791_27490 [Echinicola sediminis]